MPGPIIVGPVGETSGLSNSFIQPPTIQSSNITNSVPSGTDAYDMNKWVNYLSREANNGNSAALDMLFNYIASETNAKTARDWTAEREDSQYQRLMDDLRKAGISPYILSNALPGSSSAHVTSYSGSQMTQRSNQESQNETSLIGRVIQVLGYLIGGLAGKAIPNTNITMKK